MKRREFLYAATAIGAGGLTQAHAREGISQSGDSASGRAIGKLMTSPAVVMAPRNDGAEIIWSVVQLSRGWVEVRASSGEVKKFHSNDWGFVPQGENVLRVKLGGLPAGTEFDIRAVCEAEGNPTVREESPWKKFRTLSPEEENTRFVVWNDTHENAETIGKLHAVTPAADFMIWNGDVCNDWHQQESLASVLLNPGGCDISADRPLNLVWGNHDVRGQWAHRMPEMIATPSGRPFYAFRSGPVAVVCLHSGEDKPDDHPSFCGRTALEPLRHEQADWLKKIIRQPGFSDAPYRIVFCHIPLRWIEEHGPADYANGGYDHFALASREAWHASLVDWRAQVIISGHTHQEAWLPETPSFPYAQIVSGGPRPDSARWIEGAADSSALTLTVCDLGGTKLREHHFRPLAR